MNHHITEMKRPNHNIYGLNSFTYKMAVMVFIALWVLSFFEIPIHYMPMSVQISIWIGTLTAALLATFILAKRKTATVVPYCRKEDFHFLGLYNLKDSELNRGQDVLKRDEEVRYMKQILEDIIFHQVSIKQALCITGPSGYGKSIILNFFKQTYKDEYTIYDFAGNYHEFEGHLVSELGTTNIDLKISELTAVGKVVFILDQFERFFFLSDKEQEKIRGIIKYLCKRNTAIIVSLREEYLADFLKLFDMNNLLSSDGGQDALPCGILRKMFSVIDNNNDMNAEVSFFKRSTKTNIWEDHLVKNNGSIHLDMYDSVIMEKIGPTLLYCQNQNKIGFQLNGEMSHASILESKCRKLFDEKKGSLLFNKHIQEPLIEQQIIFHMAEFNQKVRHYSADELNAFIEKDSNELLEQYFDFQLESCNDYFNASRILYLLSQARIRQLSLKTDDVENYLFPNLFAKKGHEQFENTIEQLEKIQLIRKNTEGSRVEYEIAHDFISEAYLNYCSTNMDRNVKSALDLFILEYMDNKRNTSFKERIALRKDVFGQHFYRNLSCLTLASILITYIVQRFFFNPWTTIWNDFNPYGNFVPTFPLFITILSGIYIYFMYDKTVKYYRGEKVGANKLRYLLFAFLAYMAVFAYPHFLFFDGVGLAVATLNIALLLDQSYRQTCRNELLAYGAKSVMIGMVFACAHIFFLSMNQQFEDFLIISEFIMFTTLVAYGFFVHMTQEFLYARMSDSSGEKV